MRLSTCSFFALLCFASQAEAQFSTPSPVGTAGQACTSATMTYGWPDANGQVLKCTSNVWSLVSQVASPAGSDSQVQYNNNGSLGGSSNLTWDDTSNRLGIGTTAPLSELSVAGNLALGSYGGGVSTTAAPANGLIVSGNLGIGTASPANKLDVQSGTQFSGLRISNGPNAVANIFGVSASNDNGMLQLLNGGTVSTQIAGGAYYSYFNGSNVGIGTVTPMTALEVYTSPTQYTFIAGNYLNIVSSNSLTPLVQLNGTGGADLLQLQENGSTAFAFRGNGGVTIGTSYGGLAAPANGAIIQGNVGIGTNSPTPGLEIYSSSSQYTTLSGAAFSITSSNASTPIVQINGSAGANLLQVQQSGSPLLVVTPSGNVGIGTASPQATFDVNGYGRLKKNSSQPVACSGTNDGAIALTHVYTLCICNGGSTSWVQSKDGSTACSW